MKILYCPHCGEKNDLNLVKIRQKCAGKCALIYGDYVVRCENCGAYGEQCGSPSQAVLAWNIRHKEKIYEKTHNIFTVHKIIPVAKPRMTQSDKWKKRKCTKNYWQFKDDVNKLGIKIPESNYHIIFILPMPKTWSKNKKQEMVNKPHQQKPDKDNLEKALLDAIYNDDSHIWDGRVTKKWGKEGLIMIGYTRGKKY